MKVKDKRKSKTVKFVEIDYGDAFKWNGVTYMRIQTICTMGDVIANAIDVDNGEDAKFEYDELVEPLNAELIIRGGMIE